MWVIPTQMLGVRARMRRLTRACMEARGFSWLFAAHARGTANGGAWKSLPQKCSGAATCHTAMLSGGLGGGHAPACAPPAGQQQPALHPTNPSAPQPLVGMMEDFLFCCHWHTPYIGR